MSVLTVDVMKIDPRSRKLSCIHDPWNHDISLNVLSENVFFQCARNRRRNLRASQICIRSNVRRTKSGHVICGHLSAAGRFQHQEELFQIPLDVEGIPAFKPKL